MRIVANLMFCAVLASGWVGAAHAQNPGASYVTANAAGCLVWGPSALTSHDFVARYTGACKDGRAQGKGKMEWLYRYAELKPKAIWEGYFDNGVFVGEQASPFHVEPMPGDQYLVRIGSIPGGQLTLIAASTQTDPMALCPARTLATFLDGVAATDDEGVKRVMQGAANRYRQICSTTLGNPQLQAFDTPIEIDSHGRIPEPIARARMQWPGSEISAYNNSASDTARLHERQNAARDRLQHARQAFDAFSRQNGIMTWVTTEQLDANPFRYEGQVVGIVVALNRMLSADRALVDSAIEQGAGTVELEGVTPEFPDRRHTVLVAARAGKRVALGGGDGVQFTTLKALAIVPCADTQCSDYLSWTLGNNPIHWGEPYTPQS